jgi:hypothetical protein
MEKFGQGMYMRTKFGYTEVRRHAQVMENKIIRLKWDNLFVNFIILNSY